MYTFHGLITFVVYFAAVVGTISLFAALYFKDKK